MTEVGFCAESVSEPVPRVQTQESHRACWRVEAHSRFTGLIVVITEITNRKVEVTV